MFALVSPYAAIVVGGSLGFAALPKDVTELATGTVKFFNAEKGCGFISRGEDDDAAIADERNALLRDDLNAAQLRTARALAETHARPRAPRISEVTDSDDQLCLLLDRGYELAAGHLEGINEAALELADAAGDDRRVMERAFRVVAERVRLDPSHANNQVASLIRRAIELGMWRWDWDDTRPVP